MIRNLIILSILVLLIYINSRPLSQNVIEYLEKDEDTFVNYRKDYKFLSCKLMTYSRMKYLYEKEFIDEHVNKTNNREGFLDSLRERIMNFCLDIYKDMNVVSIIHI
jgi:hypothetical protein